jgi:putative sterol carrier protein
LGVKILQQGLGSLRGAIGTPDQVRELVSRYEAAGVDQLIFVLQAGRNRHEHICEAIELFGSDVLPDFAARADQADRAVDERLAPAVAAALARRAPARTAATGYTIAPTASGPPAGARRAVAGGAARRRGPSLRRRLVAGGEAGFRRFVHGASDRRLERLVGTPVGLRILFGGMAQRFEPEKAAGFAGEVQYDLSAGARTRSWTVEIDGDRASARPGRARAPVVTIRAGVADFVRIAAQDLEPGKALLTGRLDVEGDFAVLTRLGEMFGQPSPY